jgi:predicted O-methyltransferase YrrM
MISLGCLDDISRTLPGLHGWCTIEKAHALAELIWQEQPKLCVEIGVFGGRSLFAIATAVRATEQGFSVGIDPWCVDSVLEGESDPANREWWAKLDMESIFHGAASVLAPFIRSCGILRATSQDAAQFFGDGSIDFLHIDGNHSEKVSCRDVGLYMPKLRQGGILVFDDVDWRSTKKAQELVADYCDEVDFRQTWGAYRKR